MDHTTRPRQPDFRRTYQVNPRAINCPRCKSVVHRAHLTGSHMVAFCEARTRIVAGERFKCSLHIWVFRDDDGDCYAVPLEPAEYEKLCMLEARQRMPISSSEILIHLGLEAA